MPNRHCTSFDCWNEKVCACICRCHRSLMQEMYHTIVVHAACLIATSFSLLLLSDVLLSATVRYGPALNWCLIAVCVQEALSCLAIVVSIW